MFNNIEHYSNIEGPALLQQVITYNTLDAINSSSTGKFDCIMGQLHPQTAEVLLSFKQKKSISAAHFDQFTLELPDCGQVAQHAAELMT